MIQNDRSVRDSGGQIICRPLVPIGPDPKAHYECVCRPGVRTIVDVENGFGGIYTVHCGCGRRMRRVS